MVDTTPGKTRRITRTAILGYFNCARKAYLHMFTQERGEPCEYAAIMDHAREKARLQHIDELTRKGLSIKPFSPEMLLKGTDLISGVTLSTEIFSTECAILTKVAGKSRFGDYQYEPAIAAPAHAMRPEDKLDILFAGYVLSQVQGTPPSQGTVLLLGGNTTKVRFAPGMKHLLPHILSLKKWLREPPESFSVLLNKHCAYCEYRGACRSIAEKENNLSLLDGVTPKVAAKYEKKGIFTVKQLSYLYKPRKQSRKRPQRIAHQYELQALALRTGNIYLHEPLPIPKQNGVIFVDMESVPDRRFYYLIGLLHCTPDGSRYIPLWADKETEERAIWKKFLAFIEQHRELPLFHYGSFEPRAIAELGRRYTAPVAHILKRLFNINTSIFGRVYFPSRSNSLKDICRSIGLSWSAPEASGLQSIVWRYRYEETGDEKYRKLLLTYNQEDCENLKGLTDRLKDIDSREKTIPEVRRADNVAGDLTETGSGIVSRFTQILKSAHLSYEKSKIILKKTQEVTAERRATMPATVKSRLPIIAHKIVPVRHGQICPHHPGHALKNTEAPAQHTVIDLVFTSRGVKKTVTRYVGKRGFCGKCMNRISPPAIRKLRRQGKFGHGLKAWTTYHRLALRLSYRNICQLLGDLFDEQMKMGTLLRFIEHISRFYAQTEKLLLQQILRSRVIHVDETSVNIQGMNWYVWVFTDGKRAIFRLTQTREATVVHQLLTGYSGVLISDFYAGYDAVACAQQKCWAHLIRDLNEDLRAAPFDAELERFVSAVRDLMVPIFEAVETYGAKRRNLRKFIGGVERFYAQRITDVTYQSDLVKGYQKRFKRYRKELFLFLRRDGIPWNNNMAERAIRHLAVQRKISGSFSESGMQQYLLLLGITQSCRFQGKSLLEFLLSGSKDLNAFKGSGRETLGDWT